jgi:hypothetical protein
MTSPQLHSCRFCGHASYGGRGLVIDVWPSGLSGVIARRRYKARRAIWRPILGGAMTILYRSSVIAVVMAYAVELCLAIAN